METLNAIVTQYPAWVAAVFSILGAVWMILTALGGVLPGKSGEWCRSAGSDLAKFATWARSVFGGGK